MAGVLTGIMLARPAALFISASLGWRAVFLLSAALLSVIGILLGKMMPQYHPGGDLRYGRILTTMIALPAKMPALCWRSAYAALMFGAFNMFWTAIPVMLFERFHLSQQKIALFALAGVGGALVAPWAGRWSDRGYDNTATLGAMAVLTASFFGSLFAERAAILFALVAFAVLIDAAVQTNSVVSRRTVFGTPAAIRGRVNALYMTFQFAGGAAGSIIGTLSYHEEGWAGTAATGIGVGLVLLGLFACEAWRRLQP
jgi:predicted MFS family arabinose efflux permease